MYKVLVDSSIFVDFMFHREPFYKASSRVMELCEDKVVKGYITTSILMDLHYIFKKMSRSNKDADLAIQEILKVFKVIDISGKDIDASTKVHRKDFEEAVIEECSIRNELDYIVTRNVKDFQGKHINIVLPDELLSKF